MIRSPLSPERVAYCSRAVRPELALVTLAEILAVSDRNNRRDNLTGMLLISRGLSSRFSRARLRTSNECSRGSGVIRGIRT